MAIEYTDAIPPRKTVTVRFGEQDEVVFPHWLQKQSGLMNGDEASVRREGAGLLLEPVRGHRFTRLRGALKGHRLVKALMEERKKERER